MKTYLKWIWSRNSAEIATSIMLLYLLVVFGLFLIGPEFGFIAIIGTLILGCLHILMGSVIPGIRNHIHNFKMHLLAERIRIDLERDRIVDTLGGKIK